MKRTVRQVIVGAALSALTGCGCFEDGFLSPSSSPAFPDPIVNGKFCDGLDGWQFAQSGGQNAVGAVVPRQCAALMTEGDSFRVTLSQTFLLPPGSQMIQFEVQPADGFDLEGDWMPDAFEAFLLGPASASVVPTWKSGATSFFNLQESGVAHKALGTTFDGHTVRLDVSGLAGDTEVTLSLTLLGADDDSKTAFAVRNVQVVGE